jgi:hypothetical protein
MIVSALGIQVAGCIWVAWNKAYSALTLVAVVSFVLSVIALIYSIKANNAGTDAASRIVLTGSAVLFFAAVVIGFMGYAAGV